jgi:hypothetical protein
MKFTLQTRINKCWRVLACITLVLSTQALWAQAAYRCDDNGKMVYQAAPCASGKAVEGATKPTADQKGMADANAEQERADAKKMAAERAARARNTPSPSGAAGMNTYKTSSMQEREGIVKNKISKKKAHHKTKGAKVVKPKPSKKTKPVAGTKK